MMDIKPSQRVTSILNDLKMRKQKLLPFSKTKNQNEPNFQEEKSNLFSNRSDFINSLDNTIKTKITQQKYAILHIDETLFQNTNQQKQVEQFLKKFITKKILFQLIQIKSIMLNKIHIKGCQNSSIKQFLETKILKLNLKYALSSKSKIQPKNISDQQNIYHIFILSPPYEFEKNTNFVINQINWNQNSWIFILKNDILMQRSYIYISEKIYQQLSQSFFSYQKLKISRGKKFPPIVIVENIGSIFNEELFYKKNGHQTFQNLSQLQYNLFKVEKDLKISESIQYFHSKIFSSYLQKIYIKKSITQLIKFMNYYKRTQQNIYKKYFNIWSIITAEASIERIQKQIVDKKYFQQKHQKSIKQKVFQNWKIFYIEKKKNRY